MTEMANQIKVGGGLPFTDAQYIKWCKLLTFLFLKYGNFERERERERNVGIVSVHLSLQMKLNLIT